MILLFSIFFVWNILNAQTLELYNHKDKLVKTFWGEEDISLSIQADTTMVSFNFGGYNINSILIDGAVGGFTKDSLFIENYFEIVEEYYEDERYLGSFVVVEDVYFNRQIPLNSINYVYVDKSADDLCFALGGLGLMGYLLTPFIANNYKKGEINSEKFYWISGISIATSITGFVSGFLLRDKVYNLKEEDFYYNPFAGRERNGAYFKYNSED